MRILTTKVKLYNVRELRRYQRAGFDRALEKYREYVAQDSYPADEIMNSLKGLFEAANVKMRDWEIGAYSHSYLRADFAQEGTEELRGARAFAWIENNLLGPLRAPWGLEPVKRYDKKYSHGTHNTLYNVEDGKPRRRWTKPGELKECPFTGMCYDKDLIDALLKAIKAGDTLKEAFEGLADDVRCMIEDDDEYRSKEESFIEHAEANEYEFTADGKTV